MKEAKTEVENKLNMATVMLAPCNRISKKKKTAEETSSPNFPSFVRKTRNFLTKARNESKNKRDE